MPCEEAILTGKGTDDDWVVSKEHVLHGVQIPPYARAILRVHCIV